MKLSILFASLFLPFLLLSQEGYISNGKGGCKSFTFKTLDRTNSWSGKCQGGYANGQGTLKVYLKGKLFYTYTGNLTNGKFNGECTLKFQDGRYFEGTHTNQYPSGTNKLYYIFGYGIGEVNLGYELENGSVYDFNGKFLYSIKEGKVVIPEFDETCTQFEGMLFPTKHIYISVSNYNRQSANDFNSLEKDALIRASRESQRYTYNNSYKIYFIDGYYNGNCDPKNNDLYNFSVIATVHGACQESSAAFKLASNVVTGKGGVYELRF